jgi:hypothetical protein
MSVSLCAHCTLRVYADGELASNSPSVATPLSRGGIAITHFPSKSPVWEMDPGDVSCIPLGHSMSISALAIAAIQWRLEPGCIHVPDPARRPRRPCFWSMQLLRTVCFSMGGCRVTHCVIMATCGQEDPWMKRGGWNWPLL